MCCTWLFFAASHGCFGVSKRDGIWISFFRCHCISKFLVLYTMIFFHFFHLSFDLFSFRMVARRGIGSGVACCCYTVMLRSSWGWRRPFEKTIRGSGLKVRNAFSSRLFFFLSIIFALLSFFFLFALSAWMDCYPRFNATVTVGGRSFSRDREFQRQRYEIKGK
ncbi:hypothetical protein V8C40DRAFT_81783 [Trichoderma camerunense]